jgi:hypothetical protein
MLHDELEKLTDLQKFMDGPLLDAIKSKKDYIKERIEYNLNLQSNHWFESTCSESEVVKMYFNNPGITQEELARKFNTTSTVVSRLLTNSFKKQGYGENGLRA